MTPEQFVYLTELLASREERGFLAALREDLSEAEIYADWLEENGRDATAALLREGWTPEGGWGPRSGAITPGAVTSGAILSGQIGTYHRTSGSVNGWAAPPSILGGTVIRDPSSIRVSGTEVHHVGIQVGKPSHLGRGGVLEKGANP